MIVEHVGRDGGLPSVQETRRERSLRARETGSDQTCPADQGHRNRVPATGGGDGQRGSQSSGGRKELRHGGGGSRLTNCRSLRISHGRGTEQGLRASEVKSVYFCFVLFSRKGMISIDI